MARFKYYKRGAGELDTSNFPQILEDGFVDCAKLDEKTFMSALALNKYLEKTRQVKPIKLYVIGYVAHLRGDKDLFAVSDLYDLLNRIEIVCSSIQHESTEKVRSATITIKEIEDIMGLDHGACFFIGADSSVPRFCPEITLCASKVRTSGKVTSLKIDTDFVPDNEELIIVDDILGGGATIQMLVDKLRICGLSNPISMFVAYNEGFHSKGFEGQFSSFHAGDLI